MTEANLPAEGKTADRTDEELLLRFLDGDERCFAEIMNRYRDRVFRLVLRYVNGDRDAADDIAQQAFIKVFTEGKNFRGEGSFRSWLFTTAVNLAISETRRRARLSSEPADAAVDPRPDVSMDRAAISARLHEAAERLPEKQRLVLTLRIDAELPFSEIARIGGMTENSAKVNYHHAVAALKRMLTGTGI